MLGWLLRLLRRLLITECSFCGADIAGPRKAHGPKCPYRKSGRDSDFMIN